MRARRYSATATPSVSNPPPRFATEAGTTTSSAVPLIVGLSDTKQKRYHDSRPRLEPNSALSLQTSRSVRLSPDLPRFLTYVVSGFSRTHASPSQQHRKRKRRLGVPIRRSDLVQGSQQ